MKKLYRVTFQTPMLIEADSEGEAESTGYEFLRDAVRDSTEVWSIEPVEHEAELHREERGSLPWRSWARNGLPQETVEQILRKKEEE